MRLIGKVGSALLAGRFSDFLLTQNIESRVDAEGDDFAIWIRDEQHANQARELFAVFQSSPNDSRYTEASETARKLRRDEERRVRDIEKKTIDVRKQWATPTLSQCRITLTLMVTAAAISFLSRFGQNDQIFEFLSLAGGPLGSIRSGQLWRLITPIFLHMGVLHLLFNLYWTYQFGLLIESYVGTGRMLVLVCIIAIMSNLGQYYVSGPSFGGLSGINYGFFGFLWIKSRFDPSSRLQIPESLVIFFLIWLVLCAFNLFGPVANTAHFTGLLVGIAVAGLPLLIRRFNTR